VRRAIADCHLARAEQAHAAADVDAYTDALLALREWDHRHPALPGRAGPLARSYDALGQDDVANQDWESAYRNFSLALALDPSLSATRRRAEEARDQRLGIGAAAPADAKKSGTRELPKSIRKAGAKETVPTVAAP
jgi:uncharacterized protein HemY